jgi:hypothetical protein
MRTPPQNAQLRWGEHVMCMLDGCIQNSLCLQYMYKVSSVGAGGTEKTFQRPFQSVLEKFQN